MKENSQNPTKSEFAKSFNNENSLATTRRRSSIVSLFAKNPRKSPDLKKDAKSNKPSGPRKLAMSLNAPGKRELNTPSIAEVEENDSILSCDHLLAQYPDHISLNTLRDGEHFGEIALSFQSLRFVNILQRKEFM